MAPTTRAAVHQRDIKQRTITGASFPLLSLPRELRDLIYIATENQCSQVDITALFLSCKQVSTEASSALSTRASHIANGPTDKRRVEFHFEELPGLCRRYKFVTLIISTDISIALIDVAGIDRLGQVTPMWNMCFQFKAGLWREMMESEGKKVPPNCKVLVRSRYVEPGGKVHEELNPCD